MEAMIVSPAPGPKAFKPKSNNEKQSGSESAFAPTLDQAINNKKSSDTSPSRDSSSARTDKAHKKPQENSSDKELNDDAAAQANGAQSINANTEAVEKESGQGRNISAAAKEAAATLKNGEARFSQVQEGGGNTIAKQVISSEVKATHIDKEPAEKNQIQQQPVSDALFSSKSSKKPTVTSQFSQSLNSSSSIREEQTAPELRQKSGNTVYLQNSDTISWQQTKSNAANMLSQNTTLLQFASEESQGNNSPAIRVERFTAPSELISQNSGENTDKIAPLSAERIAAKITDIPVQPHQATTSLRDNVHSLRHNMHEQVVDAKLDQIDNKQNNQTDQQSLSSGSDSAQKNSLAASPKSIESTNETSFSQSLHNISTDKPTSSGLDTLRPGGPVYTPHIHENNIINQVLHKFRISQHMQDSRLVMKLHPAELGDLKIDVQLKDGTINANILAQTQQVQDILEKNMPRLKALMEEQGLMVNEITINLDTDVSDNNSMFEDHLAQDEKSFAAKKNFDPAATFELEQEEIEEVDYGVQPTLSGVNVMV